MNRWQPTSIIRRTITIGLVALVVKLFGFGREIVMAHYFGATSGLDAFLIALLIPTTLVQLGLGALHATFVPRYLQIRERDGDRAAAQFAVQVGALVLAVLVVATLMMLWGAPFMSWLLAPGFDAQRSTLAAQLVRHMSWVILFSGLTQFGCSLLQARERFLWVSISPLLVTGSMLLSLIWGVRRFGIWAPAYGVVVGTALQCLLMLGGALRIVPVSSLDHRWVSVGLKRFGWMTGSVLIGSSVSHTSILIDQLMASWLPAGRVAALSYANLVCNAPSMLVAEALSMVMLPALSQAAARADLSSVRSQGQTACLWVGWILVPATIVLAGWSEGLVAFCFQRGAFDSQATHLVAQALVFYALAMAPTVIGFILARMCAAIQFTAPLFWVPFLTAVMNATLNALFMQWWDHAGIALSTCVTYLIADALLLRLLRRRLAFALDRASRRYALALIALVALGLLACRMLAHGDRVVGTTLAMAVAGLWLVTGYRGWVHFRDTSSSAQVACSSRAGGAGPRHPPVIMPGHSM